MDGPSSNPAAGPLGQDPGLWSGGMRDRGVVRERGRELNTMRPIIINNVLHSARIL
jgi:hypothetical protein